MDELPVTRSSKGAASAGKPFLATLQSHDARNPLSLTSGAQAGMKSQSCAIWVLGALIVMASLDAVPDPPAVNPHTVHVASRLCQAAGGLCERRLNCNWSCASSHLQMRWIAFTPADEPNLPSDRTALTGHAADPSPPALEARHELYFQS